jgi:hypothetical protein
MTAPNDKSKMEFGSSFAVQDPETVAVLQDPVDLSCLYDTKVVQQFLDKYNDWIFTTKQNTIKGLDTFAYRCYSNGTTESFDKFYLKHSLRRFRCFRGDYMYHKLAWRNTHNWAWLDDDAVREGDAVIISLPFADTGDVHSQYHLTMQTCSKLNIPVLVDCAYFGICSDIDFDLSYPCITDVVFSLSKTFPVAHARIGMRYTKEDDDDTLFMYHKITYNNKIGAALGLRFLERFSPDYIPHKYKHKQLEFCKILNVYPSKTVLFGQGGPEWHHYNRGGIMNRLSFHKQFIQGINYAGSNT